jgi:hypothetical protein
VSAIVQFLNLEPGWNSHAAAPPSLAAAEASLDVLVMAVGLAAPAPSLVPLSTGGLQLEWHIGGVDLEAAIEQDGTLAVLYEDSRTGEQWEREFDRDIAPLLPSLEVLAQRVTA